MRFTVAAAAVLGMVSSVFAQEVTKDFDSISSPEEGDVVKAGSTVKIAWTIGDEDKYGDMKVDIGIYGGKDGASLQLEETIASGVDNSDLKYSWEVSSKLGDKKQYGILISGSDDESIRQWSQPFTIKKVGGDDNDDDKEEDGDDKDNSTGAATESATKTKHTGTASSTIMTTPTEKPETSDKPSTTMAVTTSAAEEDGSSTKGGPAETSGTPTPVPTDSAARQVGAGAVAALGGVAVALFAM